MFAAHLRNLDSLKDGRRNPGHARLYATKLFFKFNLRGELYFERAPRTVSRVKGVGTGNVCLALEPRGVCSEVKLNLYPDTNAWSGRQSEYAQMMCFIICFVYKKNLSESSVELTWH